MPPHSLRYAVPLSERCHGRWYGILTALSIEPKILNRRNQPCPMCKGKDRFRWTNHNDNGGYFCSQCGHGDGVKFVMEFFGVDFKGAAERIEGVIGSTEYDRHPKRDDEALKAAMKAVWTSGQRVTATDPVGLYLRNRGLDLTTFPTALRHVPSLRHEDGVGPAMIAQIVAPDGTAANVHRTWLTDEGHKAAFTPCRKVMAGSIPEGSAIRLGVAGPVLGIAEGIETAMAASQRFNVPVWAVISAGGMQKFRPPAGVERLVIFGDHDRSFVGQAAAFGAARDITNQALRDGRTIEVQVKIPPTTGTDWADVIPSQVSPFTVIPGGTK